jgi:DNA polymerase-1
MTAQLLEVVEHPPGLADVKLHLVENTSDVFDFWRWLSEQSEVCLDTETTGLSIERDHVRLVQFGNEVEGWAIPMELWSGLVRDAVARYAGWYNLHNAPFDVGMLDKHGIHVPIHKTTDTRLRAHTLWSTGSLALKKLGVQHVDPAAAVGQEILEDAMRRNGWTWATVPWNFEPYWAYGALDTVITRRLERKLKPLVDADAPAAYELEHAVQWVTMKMERRGTPVDLEYVRTLATEMRQYVAQVEEWCQQVYGVKPGSNDKIVEILRRDGVNLVKRTPNGSKLALDAEVLSRVMEETGHPLAGAVLGRRKADKAVGTYLDNYLQLTDADGLIHPSINTVGGTDQNMFEPGGGQGVRTGRMSMSDPNLQNVPTRTVMGDRIRNSFKAREGYRWLKADFSQIEMRVIGFLANGYDQSLLNAFLTPGDFFVNMGREIFEDPKFAKSDPRRQYVKNGGYARAYGSGIRKFALTVGTDEETAAAFLQRFDATYPGIKAMQRATERQARENLANEGVAYVRSHITGRKHTSDESNLYKIVNYLVQGTAGELLKIKILEADAAGLDPYMLFPVHDELDLEVPEQEFTEVFHTLHGIMNDDKILAPVPVTASISAGERWGSLEDVRLAA